MRRNEEELKKISSGIGKVEVVTILIFRNIMMMSDDNDDEVGIEHTALLDNASDFLGHNLNIFFQ